MNEFVEMINKDADHRNQVLSSGYHGCDVVVLGQGQAKMYIPETDNEVCISISSEHWGDFKPILSDKFHEVLRLNFDDIAIGDTDLENANSITPHQANEVVRFFDKHKDSHRIIIHCFAGMSRSRSMAGALCKCFGLPFRYTVLNQHVEDQITQAYHKLFGE